MVPSVLPVVVQNAAEPAVGAAVLVAVAVAEHLPMLQAALRRLHPGLHLFRN